VSPPESPRWLLLIHQIPPKPSYLRVKVGFGGIWWMRSSQRGLSGGLTPTD